jgi:OmcA/MtrC family decaheme c-type cytochrome
MRIETIIRLAVALVVAVGAAVLLSSSDKPAFTAADKAFYADQNLINFVRPGLVLKIISGEIAADGTMKVRFKLTDPKGLPLDREGITTPGAINVRMLAAYIPKGKTQYVSYATRTQTSPITNRSAVQASTDSGGVFQKVAEGEYIYTFATKAPAGFDKTATHAIGVYATRDLAEFDLAMLSNADDEVYTFVPDGSKVTVTRDVIRTQSCNRCHDPLALHGGSRRTMEVCVFCHTPQTVDPDTGNTVDMPVMIHKIHRGEGLPSVVAGRPYQIIGNQQSVQDYSHVAFPTDTRNCVICHEQNTGAAQATAWLKPNRAACGACHDNVNFATGEAHANLPQVSDNQCASCHFPQGELEFDVSVRGAHTVPRFSRDLPGVVFDILAVNDGVAGKRPSVTFTVKDKSGKPIPLAQMNRLNLILAGPNTDYATYISEDVRTADGTADGRSWWTFQTPIPADAKGSYSIAIEGRREIKLMQRTTEITARDAGVNKVFAFAVDGSKPAPRRTVVSLAKCNSCHYSLSFHGDNRNAVEACVVCHNPLRTAGTGGTLTVDFRTMVHRIHTGEELKIPYVIGSYNFNRVLYPGDRRNCAACHVDGSEQLPLQGSGRLNVVESSAYVNPASPITAACTSCHTSQATASHALANTTRLGESCDACHATGREFGVPKVHAR